MGIIIGGVSALDLILDSQSVSLYVGGNPPTKVWPTIRETVQITLGPGFQARDQLRAALSARGLDYRTVEKIPFDIELLGSGSAQYMFFGCSSLTSVPGMDTSQVTDMNWMFSYCPSLTHVPDLDTSQVTNMNSMFQGCSSLTHAPEMDTGQVTNMSDMFADCSSLTSVPAMDTSSVTSMTVMFSFCSSLTSAPNMDTAQVTNMGGMFQGCSALTTVPDLDAANVTDAGWMFWSCSALADGNVRLIGKHPDVDTTGMIDNSGLTREPFYDTNGNPI